MKIIIRIIVIVFVLFGISANARTITESRDNTATANTESTTIGCDRSVVESHSGGFLGTGWGATSTLICQFPGTLACKWQNNPYSITINDAGTGSPIDVSDMRDYVLDQLDSNVLSGTYNNNIYFENEYILKSVQWSATSTTDYTFTINVNILE